VKPRFKKEGVERIVDPKLGNDYNKETMSVMTEVALMCAASSKNDRPSMKVCTKLLLLLYYLRSCLELDCLGFRL
jgi:hypothetical protein